MSRADDRTATTREARRGFLKGAAAAGGAVTVAVAARGAAAAPEPVPSSADASGQGYRESAHVRAYYKTAAM